MARSVYCTEYPVSIVYMHRVPSQCSVYAQSTQISVLYMHRVPRSVCCIQYSDQCIVQSTQPAPMARSVYCTEYPAHSHGQISVLYRVLRQCSIYAQSTQISVLYMHSVPRSVYCTEYPDQCVVFSNQISVLYRVPSPLSWPDQCIA